ncbi:phospholipid phosphatase 1 [Patella vulgata]|uniref:phospholipid phosphatase 1 n=1 Tax=Patella vulgata TaxID=6465 RepID=UPI00218043E3|nr:phospholipid phosphatase 1 [Patella vulgata]
MNSTKLCLLQNFSNYVLFIIVFMGSGVLYLFVDPHQRGFFCNDDSIKYPFKISTISTPVLYTIAAILPIIAMCIGEIIHTLSIINEREAVGSMKLSRSRLICEQISHLCVTFLFGLAVTQFTSDITKYSIGRLRPHFLDVCKPMDYNCTGNYVDVFKCGAGTDSGIKQSRLSFPSGHAAMSMYGMAYLVLYLQQRLHVPTVWLIKPFLQILCLYLTLYCGLTRIFDYWHHPADVLTGFILGFLVAFIMVAKVNNFFAVQEILPASDRERRASSVKII